MRPSLDKPPLRIRLSPAPTVFFVDAVNILFTLSR
jgi:hypothetical protein